MNETTQHKTSFIAQTLNIFAVTILSISFFTWLFGAEASEVSAIFMLEEKGIALQTIVQIFILSISVSAINRLFTWDRILKKALLVWRIAAMMLCIFVVTSIYIAIFKWFPFTNIGGWLSFIATYSVSVIASCTFMYLKTKHDEKQYTKLLNQYKQEH